MRREIKRLLRFLPKSVTGTLAYWLASGKTTYSQFGEDMQIDRLLPVSKGFYVDIGAFHPKFGSNTYLLSKRGWKGINIDVDDYKIKLFERYRKNDINIATGISSTPGTKRFYVQEGESFGSMSTFEESFATDRAQHLGRSVTSHEVPVATLNDILEKHLPLMPNKQLQRIDFVNVDVEGHELDILKSFDFWKYRPKIFCIEIHAKDLSELQASDCYILLTDMGYELAAWPSPSCLFVDGNDTEMPRSSTACKHLDSQGRNESTRVHADAC